MHQMASTTHIEKWAMEQRLLVLFQHFRGNLDNRDPALIDRLASQRRVVTFDSVGVGATTGQTPHTVEQAADHDALSFLRAKAQPDSGRPPRFLNRKLRCTGTPCSIIARSDRPEGDPCVSRRPKAGPGMRGRAPEVIDAVGKPQTDPQGYLDVFFTRSSSSPAQRRRGGSQADVRQNRRPRYANHLGKRVQAQYDAVCTWGIPNHSQLERLGSIDVPVFGCRNGDSDPMILPRYSYLLAGLLPRAMIKIYPDSAHGFLFQHNEQFAADIEAFLGP